MKLSKLLIVLLILALIEIVILVLEKDDPVVTPVKSKIDVSVFFNNPRLTLNPKLCNDVFPVKRKVEIELGDVPAEIAVKQLLMGPNKNEQKAGYHSYFNVTTSGKFNYLHQKDGEVRVDFKDLRSVLTDVDAPCAAAELLAQLTSTVQEYFPEKFIIFSINGNVDQFYRWLNMAPPINSTAPE